MTNGFIQKALDIGVFVQPPNGPPLILTRYQRETVIRLFRAKKSLLFIARKMAYAHCTSEESYLKLIAPAEDAVEEVLRNFVRRHR